MKKERFIITGLDGNKVLNGSVSINGAKNAVLKVMAGAILFDDEITLTNVPDTEDVKKMILLLRKLGAKVSDVVDKHVTIDASTIASSDLDSTLSQSMRSSIVLTGPLLARFGRVSFPAPGGCVIGARPIDLFIEGYKKMGAQVELHNDRYVITAEKLKGSEIFFNIPTVGGTETLMMSAVLAQGTTLLKNCAMEPEIVSQAEYLNSCGADIRGAGTATIEIRGGGLLTSKGKSYVTIPDRIETGSFLLLGALCADNLEIRDCNPLHLESLIALLTSSGVPIATTRDTICIKNNGSIKNQTFTSFNVRTHEYPGFPTDLQAPIVTFLTQTSGESIVFETIYEGRFKYVEDLVKMGAHITMMNPREILVKGYTDLTVRGDEDLEAHDIRAGFAVVMASLVAKGISTINNVYYIDRGYEKIETRLRALGADIRREVA